MKITFTGPRCVGLLVASIVWILDQISKWFSSIMLADGGITIIPGFFDFDLVHNRGAAFGMFTTLPPFWRTTLLLGVATSATIFILILLYKNRKIWDALALGLVLGGALGNLTDRLRFGWVVDFIHLHWHDLSWPVFNLADSAITLGVGILLWNSFRETEATHP